MKPYQQISKLILLLALLALTAQSISAFYDPSVGRWITRDPIQESDGVNIFRFLHNEPLGHSDSYGLVEGSTIYLGIYRGDPEDWPPPGHLIPPEVPTPRNCAIEAANCGARGLVVCGLFEAGLAEGGPWPYRCCIYLYGLACAQQFRECQQWNRDHGFPP
jgi:hypothetical protein